jgi:hypothetical protein
MSQDFNTPKPENPNNLPEAEDILPAGESVMSSVPGDNVNTALPAPESGNNDETRPHIIDGLGSTATKTAGIAYDTFLMAGESYGQYVKGLEVVSTQIERAGKYVVRGIGSAAIKASGLAVKGVKGMGNGIWQAAKVSGRGLEAGGKLAERVGKNTFEASSVMLTGLNKVVKPVRLRLAGGNDTEIGSDAMFYRDAAGSSLKKLEPGKPYAPIQNFAKQNMITSFLHEYPMPAEVHEPAPTRARTRHQEMVAIRQNLRVDAINRRALVRNKFNALYGDRFSLTDKEALRGELKTGRYTYGQKRAIRSAGNMVRGANESITNIQGRIERVSQGRDIASRVIRARAKIGGINQALVGGTNISGNHTPVGAGAAAVVTPESLVSTKPTTVEASQPEQQSAAGSKPVGPAVKRPKKSNLHDQPAKATTPAVTTQPSIREKAATPVKQEFSPEDFEKDALIYVAGQTRKDMPGVPFPSMSPESLTKRFERVFKISKDEAGPIALRLFWKLQQEGVISTYHTPMVGFVVNSVKALEKFQEVTEKAD